MASPPKGTRSGPARGRVARAGALRPAGQRPRRLLAVLAAPVVRPVRARRTRRLADWNIDNPKRWRRKRIKLRVLEIVSYLGAVLLVAGVVASAYVMIVGSPGFLAGINKRCDIYSQSCGTVFG